MKKGYKVTSDWKPGSRITWKGEWEGKPYEDKGVVVATDQARLHSEKNWSQMLAGLKKYAEE
jgi:hypothetical protein